MKTNYEDLIGKMNKAILASLEMKRIAEAYKRKVYDAHHS